MGAMRSRSPDARAAVARLPSAPGVYRFRDTRGRVLYIGRATDLRRRVDSYWGDLRDRAHLSRMVARVARIEAACCDSVHEAAWLERNLLERAMPYWNRTPGGQEVPFYIRLDTGSRAPGLQAVHSVQSTSDAKYYGPYLGGQKVRLAVSALHRVLPLAYAADGLRGAERDMARVRGVAPAGRGG
jgi:excinuclease ABC subunit C